MKIVVFNLCHGANLGDRLIAECLAAELRMADPSLDIITEDLAGRDAPQTGTGGRGVRLMALWILALLPNFARQAIAGRVLDRLVVRRLIPRWRAMLSNADAVVIGGGGIFADSDLNFPKKIGAALRVAAERKLPVAIHAVGVSPDWSRTGRRLFAEGLLAAVPSSISVRDDRAAAMWIAELAEYPLPDVMIAPDPALTLASHFPAVTNVASSSMAIGLCITSPAALQYHTGTIRSSHQIGRWYCSLAAELTGRGYEVVGFTTGAIEDNRFATSIREQFVAATGGRGRIEPPSASATELVLLINACRAVVAHRLHALIIAYALGIPGLALSWEAKMKGQMEMLGHEERLVDPASLTPEAASDRVEEIITEGVDLVRRAALIAQVRTSTSALVDTLQLSTRRHD